MLASSYALLHMFVGFLQACEDEHIFSGNQQFLPGCPNHSFGVVAAVIFM